MTDLRKEGALSDEELLDQSGPAIEVRGLSSVFGDHVVHENLDLTVKRGEVLGVVGGSGTGKSVLLNTIIGLRDPDKGQVTVFGQQLWRASRRRWSALERSWGCCFRVGRCFPTSPCARTSPPRCSNIPSCRAARRMN